MRSQALPGAPAQLAAAPHQQRLVLACSTPQIARAMSKATALPGMLPSGSRLLRSGAAKAATARRPCRARPGQVYNIQAPTTRAQGGTQPADSSSADPGLTELARLNLRRAAVSCRRYGWLAFWSQLVLSTISTIVLLFSAAFTPQNVPPLSVYLTLFGVVAGFLSTFWAFGYTRLSRRLFAYLDSPGVDALKKVKRSEVTSTIEKGIIINTLGMGSTLLGLCATVGTLMAKTLTTATSNPFVASNQGSWNPVLALDIFNVQASTNTLLAHFISCACSLWMLKTVSDKRAPKAV